MTSSPETRKAIADIMSRASLVLSDSLDSSEWVFANLGIDLNDNQIEILDSILDLSISNVVVIGARGSGKTMAVACALTKLCCDMPNFRVGVFAPKWHQASRVIKEIAPYIEQKQCRLYDRIDWKKTVKTTMHFKNGSSITCISANETTMSEGEHFQLIVIDEAHMVASISVSQKIGPMLGSFRVAKMVKLGVAMYDNHFYESFLSPNYKKIVHDWTQCKRLLMSGSVWLDGKEYPRKTLIDQMPLGLKQRLFPNHPEIHVPGDIDEIDFMTNYMVQWVKDVRTYLNKTEQIMLMGEHQLETRGYGNEIYFFGLDFAQGSTMEDSRQDNDWTVLSIWKKAEGGVKLKIFTREWQGNPIGQIDEIRGLVHPQTGLFPCKAGLADYANIGSVAIQAMRRDGILVQGIMFGQTEKDSGKNYKNAMYDNFKFELNNGRIKYPRLTDKVINKAYQEWCHLERREGVGINRKIAAAEGYHDDHPSCLSGDTLIPLLDGQCVSIKSLADHLPEDTWVYSVDPATGSIAAGLVEKSWLVGTRKTVVVTLDNGQQVICTPDHLFMDRKGGFIPGGGLIAGDSLMPLYRERRVLMKSLDYEYVYDPGKDKFILTHRAVVDVPLKKVPHHKNFNRLDNRPTNIQIMGNHEHFALHGASAARVNERVWGGMDLEQRRARLKNASEGNKAMWRDPVKRAALIKKISERQKRKMADPVFRARTMAAFARMWSTKEGWRAKSIGGKRRWAAMTPEERVEKMRPLVEKAAKLRRGQKLYPNGRVFTAEHKENIRKAALARFQRKRVQETALTNHKVVSVTPGPEVEVYDMSVAKYHNFALQAGVFVHNCDILACFVATRADMAGFKEPGRMHLPTSFVTMPSIANASGNRQNPFMLRRV